MRRIPDPEAEVGAGGQDWVRWVIARRRPQDGEAGKHDYYLAWGPEQTTVEELVQVPSARWRVEEVIKLAKSAVGMDDYEVRSWHGWFRHVTLAQLAPRSWPSRPPWPPARSRRPPTPMAIRSRSSPPSPGRRPGERG